MPLHRIKRPRDLRELMRRLEIQGWVGRPLLVELVDRSHYQAWTGTHRLAAARRLGLRTVPVVTINLAKWVKAHGPIKTLAVDMATNDELRYSGLMAAGDKIAARIMQEEWEMNKNGDEQGFL